MIKPILKLFIAAFLLLAIIVFATDLAFQGIYINTVSSDMAYWMSESAGKWGTTFILIVTCFFYTRFVSGTGEKLRVFAFSFVKLLLIIGAFAFINEYWVKHTLKLSRPSHAYILDRNNNTSFTTAHLYKLTNEAKQKMLENIVRQNPEKFADINPDVLRHWTVETGYSFPSGHSFNSFLLAFVLSYSLYYSRSKAANATWWVPVLWAFMVAASRVALGVHTCWDVTFGAATGISVAALLMHFDLLRKSLLHRDHSKREPRYKVVDI